MTCSFRITCSVSFTAIHNADNSRETLYYGGVDQHYIHRTVLYTEYLLRQSTSRERTPSSCTCVQLLLPLLPISPDRNGLYSPTPLFILSSSLSASSLLSALSSHRVGVLPIGGLPPRCTCPTMDERIVLPVRMPPPPAGART